MAISFRKYKRNFISLCRRILENCDPGEFNEQALPSYTNPNPLMRFLFWRRVKIIMDHISELENLDICMDFGCGLGVMIPYLNRRVKQVYAVDLDVSLLKEIGDDQGWTKVEYLTNLGNLKNLHGKIDLILAMDVLEHVNDVEDILENFYELLSDDGIIIISGPTENQIYKIGRTLANFRGDYHERNIYDIIKKTEEKFKVLRIRTLFKLLPFFEIYTAKKI